jgi:ribosome-interacting GTPase 1
MPANLTPDYRAAEQRFRDAPTVEEKLAALDEMLATIPKHKGTEKMQADIKRRIAKLKTDSDRRPSKKKAFFVVDKEGAGQIAFVGPANTGKSRLLAAVSNATPEVAAYPFTTQVPVPGMIRYENVQVQALDLPPLDAVLSPPWLMGVIKSADAMVLIFDLSSDELLDQVEATFGLLEASNLTPLAAKGERGHRAKSAFVVASKSDAPGAADRLAMLEEACPRDLTILPLSAETGHNLDRFRREVFDLLGCIRVYTKAPGQKVDLNAPFVIRRGTTLVEAAAVVHKDFADRLKFARVWGSATFDGQMVQRDYVMRDGDTVEFHV